MTTTPMAAEGLTKQELAEYAVAKYASQQQWCDSVKLAPDAFLANDSGFVYLYRKTREPGKKYHSVKRLGLVFYLDPYDGGWKVSQEVKSRVTREQDMDELFGEQARQRDTAILAQSPTRGRSKLFK